MLNKIKQWLSDKLGPGSSVYGIFKPCRRCVYQKSHEPILIISKYRGPRIIIYPDKQKVYVRTGKCNSYHECLKCFNVVENKANKECKWIEI